MITLQEHCSQGFIVWVCCALVQFVAVLPLLRQLSRSMKIVNISKQDDSVIVTTLKKHEVKMHGGRLMRVTFAGTGHPCFDTKYAWYSFKKPDRQLMFCVRVLDEFRLEVFTRDRKAISVPIESSMGWLYPLFPDSIVSTGPYIPTALLTCIILPFPWLIALADPRSGAMQYTAQAVVGATLATILVLFMKARFRTQNTAMEARLNNFAKLLLERNPKPSGCARGPERGMTIGQLGELLNFFRDFIRDRNAYYLDPNIIRPLTRPFQMSMAEVCGPQRAEFFVSHYWGTSTVHFVETLEKHAKTTCRDHRSGPSQDSVSPPVWNSVSYWVCFCSNSQWHITDELGHGDWKESSFYKTLQSGSIRATCMVLDENALPLTRSWCLFEVLQTYILVHDELFSNFEGLKFCTDRGMLGAAASSDDLESSFDIALALANKLSVLKVEDASATDEKDEQMIRDLVDQQGGMESMNHFIRHNMLSDLHLVRTNFESTLGHLETLLSARSSP